MFIMDSPVFLQSLVGPLFQGLPCFILSPLVFGLLRVGFYTQSPIR